MQGFGSHLGFARSTVAATRSRPITLIDVGCSLGFDRAWEAFGDELIAYGFDPNIAEVERLTSIEHRPNAHYIAGFVGVRKSHSLRGGRGPWENNPGPHLAVFKTIEVRRAANIAPSTSMNDWSRMELTEAPVIDLSAFIAERAIAEIDFIKIDVDGADFHILQGLRADLESRAVLGVGIEVNFFGSAEPDHHTFHNVDRFMRETGFGLAGLTTRPYSAAALPARYTYRHHGQSLTGRPWQGDAIYLREPLPAFPGSDDPRKRLKLAALYSMVQLPDMAAQTLLHAREALEPIYDVGAGLDLLARQIGLFETYEAHMAAFARDDAAFYAPR